MALQDLRHLTAALFTICNPKHALASQLVAEPYELSDELFPQVKRLRGQTGQVAAYINRLLEATTARCQLDVTGNIKSHPARRGSAAQVAAAEGVSPSDLAHRGAWRVNDVHTVLECVAETSSADFRVAKSLGGWEQPWRPVRAAQLEQGTMTSKTQNRFTEILFQHHSA
ncbi:hypothetical protein PybrP1_000288 [[Pythium] brassicae (nom. inval.)]|nr:hypothetical protein PybrP1_000288 [[Pythium] brassicae (nom. inval.)]